MSGGILSRGDFVLDSSSATPDPVIDCPKAGKSSRCLTAATGSALPSTLCGMVNEGQLSAEY